MKGAMTYMTCNKYSLLNIYLFLKAGPRKNFGSKPVRSAKRFLTPGLGH